MAAETAFRRSAAADQANILRRRRFPGNPPLHTTHRFPLQDTGFQPHNAFPAESGITLEAIDYRPPQSAAAELRPHVHPLDLGVFAATFQRAASGCRAVNPQDEEIRLFSQQLFHRVSVMAYGRIKGNEMGVESGHQGAGVAAVGVFGGDSIGYETQLKTGTARLPP
jgi:hypothetical protein